MKLVQIFLATVLFLIVVLIILSGIPSLGKYQLMVVLSGSMEPDIKTGSLVVVSPDDDYERGDIITFSFDQKREPRTHRIKDVKMIEGELVYTTKGDANRSVDQRDVFKENIIGKVLFSIPYVGYLINFAKTKLGFAILISIPVIIIIYDQVQRIVRKIKLSQKDKNKVN